MVYFTRFGCFLIAFCSRSKNIKTQVYGIFRSLRNRSFYGLSCNNFFWLNGRKRLETWSWNATFPWRLVKSRLNDSKHYACFSISDELFPHLQRYLIIFMKGLKNSNDTKMSRACLVGLCTVAFFYILVGNVGYAMYGK